MVATTVTEVLEVTGNTTKAAEATGEGYGCHGKFNHAREVTTEAMAATEEGHEAHEGYGTYNRYCGDHHRRCQ